MRWNGLWNAIISFCLGDLERFKDIYILFVKGGKAVHATVWPSSRHNPARGCIVTNSIRRLRSHALIPLKKSTPMAQMKCDSACKVKTNNVTWSPHTPCTQLQSCPPLSSFLTPKGLALTVVVILEPGSRYSSGENCHQMFHKLGDFRLCIGRSLRPANILFSTRVRKSKAGIGFWEHTTFCVETLRPNCDCDFGAVIAHSSRNKFAVFALQVQQSFAFIVGYCDVQRPVVDAKIRINLSPLTQFILLATAMFAFDFISPGQPILNKSQLLLTSAL